MARSGEEALERLKISVFDAIVSGLRLPGMSGIALLQSFRCGGNRTPFIILAERPDMKTVMDAFNNGVSAFIDTGTEGGLLPGNLCMAVIRAVEEYRSLLAIRKERDQFRVILSAQKTGLALINPDLTIAWANEETRRLFPCREPVGTSCHLFYEGLDHPCEPCPTIRTFETGTVQENERYDPLDRRWYHIITQPVRNREGRVIQVLEGITDVTDRRRAEEDLRLSQEKYRELVENANSIIFRSDKEGNITFFNDFAQRFFGFSAAEILGKERYRHHRSGKRQRGEGPCGHDPGDQGAPGSGTGTTRTRTSRRTGNGSGSPGPTGPSTTRRGSSWNSSPWEMISPTGSGPKRRSLPRTGKLNLLSNVTRHDVLNQLNVLAGYLGLVRDRVSDVDTAALLSRAWDSTWTIRKLIAFTKDYQEIGVQSPWWHDITKTVARAVSPLDLEGIALEVDVGDLQIYADPLLEKVFYALLDNALRHGERIDRIRISYRTEGGGLAIVVEDNGVGIPPGEKERIFARGAGKNTGYGLFISREIPLHHGPLHQ